MPQYYEGCNGFVKTRASSCVISPQSNAEFRFSRTPNIQMTPGEIDSQRAREALISARHSTVFCAADRRAATPTSTAGTVSNAAGDAHDLEHHQQHLKQCPLLK